MNLSRIRRPRNPVPPNTVAVRPLVATISQTRQFMSALLWLPRTHRIIRIV
ncbi:hypothetical protein [Bradyrhizobium betae]|uniref:hypothetical protein n=1 Tax=Bradyrhizobium betae TaxID=244734 RepID=UPI0013E946B7|nr:hypothetical protein [Bradyrhizobium betae]